MLWNRQKVADAIQAINNNIVIEYLDSAGGDWDTVGLRILLKTVQDTNGYNSITITPFKDPDCRNPNYEIQDDYDVYAIELRTNGDSRGGCQSKNTDISHLYMDIKLLLQSMKFHIINHYDEIF